MLIGLSISRLASLSIECSAVKMKRHHRRGPPPIAAYRHVCTRSSSISAFNEHEAPGMSRSPAHDAEIIDVTPARGGRRYSVAETSPLSLMSAFDYFISQYHIAGRAGARLRKIDEKWRDEVSVR